MFNLAGVGHIGRCNEHFRAQLPAFGGGLFQLGHAAGGQRQFGPFPGVGDGDCLPDTAAGACDQRDLVIQFWHITPSKRLTLTPGISQLFFCGLWRPNYHLAALVPLDQQRLSSDLCSGFRVDLEIPVESGEF